MDKHIIKLTGEKELRIFMQPLRQKILRTMLIVGKPMTAKQLADTLGITPSSAKHHLTQLESIGIVGIHHTEQIHGITATFYSHLPVTVSIGLDDNELLDDRLAVSENLIMSVYSGFRERCKDYAVSEKSNHFVGDLLTGVLHLQQEDADTLYEMVRTFIAEYETPVEGSIPFEYGLMLYKVGDAER